MRIITGKYRGRVLKGPKHQGVRPTANRVREALFNIITPILVDGDFLDLFAGTGGIGIEALSRGVNSVTFVDANAASISLLKSNLHFIDAEDNVRIIHAPAEKALQMLAGESLSFDIVFLDPPFEAGLLDRNIRFIWEHNLIKPQGVLIAEHPRKIEVAPVSTVESLVRHYGDISLTIMRKTTQA